MKKSHLYPYLYLSVLLFVFFGGIFTGTVLAVDPNCGCGQVCGLCGTDTPGYMLVTLTGLQGCPDYFHEGAATEYPCFGSSQKIICRQDPNYPCGYYYIGPVFDMNGSPYDYRFKFYLDFGVAGDMTEFSVITQENFYGWYDDFFSRVSAQGGCDRSGSANFFSYCNGPTPDIYEGSASWQPVVLADGNCPSCELGEIGNNCDALSCSSLAQYTAFEGGQAFYDGPQTVYSAPSGNSDGRGGNTINTARIYCPGADFVVTKITGGDANNVKVSASPDGCGSADEAVFSIHALRGSAKVTLSATFYQKVSAEECIVLKTKKTVTINVKPDEGSRCGRNWQRPVLLSGSPGNVSSKIRAGVNPLDEWPKARMYQAGNNSDIEVILPGSFTPVIFNNGKAPPYLLGYKAQALDSNQIVISSPQGKEFIYDRGNDYKISLIKNPDGVNTVEFVYDSNDRPLRQNDLINQNYYISYHYDSNGLLVEIREHDTADDYREFDISYDGYRVSGISSGCGSCGREISNRKYYYNNDGLVEFETAPDGTILYQYAYDSDGRLTEKWLGSKMDNRPVILKKYQDGTGGYIADTNEYINSYDCRVKREVFNTAGLLLSKTVFENLNENPDQPAGRYYTEEYTYDYSESTGALRKKEIIHPGGAKTEYIYDVNTGDLLAQNASDANGSVTNVISNSYEYIDANGQTTLLPQQIYISRLIEQIDSSDANTVFGYTSSLVTSTMVLQTVAGAPLAEAGLKREYTLDSSDRITSAQFLNPDTQQNLLTASYSYDDFGNIISQRFFDSNDVNEITDCRYNAFNQPVRIKLPGGAVLGKSYNRQGQLVSEYTLGDAGDINSAEPNLVKQTVYTYDANGRMKTLARALDSGEFVFAQPKKWVYTRFEYDSLGRLRKTTEDANETGRVTLFEYNYQGELTKVTYPYGGWTEYIRDGRGLVTEKINGFSSSDLLIREFAYDRNGNLSKQVNPDGSVYSMEYDNLGRCVRQRLCGYSDPNSCIQTAVYEYDSVGNMTAERVYDAGGVMASEKLSDYDGPGRLWRQRTSAVPGLSDDANDMIVLYRRNCLGDITQMALKNTGSTGANSIDEANDVLFNTGYDAMGRVRELIDAEGDTTRLSRDAGGQILSVTNARGLITANTYDPYGRIQRTTMPDNHYVLFKYDSLDRVTRQIVYDSNDTAVEQRRFEYDNLGNLTRSTVLAAASSTAAVNTAVDAVTDYDYNDVTGLLDGRTNRYNGSRLARTQCVYDALGRLTKIIDPNGSSSEVFYDPNMPGQIFKQQFVYNGSTESRTVTTYLDYDDYGRLVSSRLYNNQSSDFNDITTYYYHDCLGRITKQITGGGLVTDFEYDAFGNLVKTIEDPCGINLITEHSFDRLDRRISDITYDPNRQRTEYRYDKNARPVKMIYPDGKTIEYAYNALGKIIEQKNRNGKSIYYGYDNTGNLVWQSDDANGPAGDVNNCEFLIEFAYSPTGRITYAAKTVNGQIIARSYFKYDGVENITQEQVYLYDFAPKTIQYSYDQAGNMVSSNFDGRTRDYTYDGLGRVKTVKFNDTQIAVCNYMGPNIESLRYPEPNITTTYGYDAIDRITEISSTDSTGSGLMDYIYAYNDAANRKSLAYSHPSAAAEDEYSYDALGRISRAEYGAENESEEFTYDAPGNRKTVQTKQGFTDTYSHNELNQYTNIHTAYNFGGLSNDAELSYGDNGNMSWEKINGLVYQFDSLGNLIKVTLGDDVIAEFAYDALGRRIYSKTNEGGRRLFYYDLRSRPIAEFKIQTGGATLSRSFIYGNGQNNVLAMFLPEKSVDVNEVIKLYEFCDSYLCSANEPGFNSSYDYDDNGRVDMADYAVFTSQNSFSLPNIEETRWYYLKDALGSTVGLIGGKFNRPDDREFYHYDVFGRPSRSSDAGNPYFFAGYIYDKQIDKYYCLNRYYDPSLGAFLSPDKLGYADGLNLYQYAGNNPIMFSDALGLKSSLKDELQFLLGSGDVRRRAAVLTENLKKNCRSLKADCAITDCAGNAKNSVCGRAKNCFSAYRTARAADDAIGAQCARATAFAAVAGTTQGLLNTANGIQDILIGTVNLGSGIWNYSGAFICDKKLAYLKSPDWSKNMVVKESSFAHSVSKFLGSEGAMTLMTAGLSEWKNARQLIKMQKTGPDAQQVVEGVYEFTASSGRTYVGQSGNISRRIIQHLKSGKLLAKDIKTLRAAEVGRGRLAREIAEQLRINRLGGIDKLENMKNAIGPARSYLLRR